MGTGRDKFKKFKSLINIAVAIDGIFPDGFNYCLLRLFRNTNGTIGLLIRYILIKNLAKSCGDNVSVHPNVFLFNLHGLSFGNNVSIHPMCYIDGIGEITIGNDVSIAHNCSIISANHTWDDLSLPIKYNHQVLSRVSIANDVWLGRLPDSRWCKYW